VLTSRHNFVRIVRGDLLLQNLACGIGMETIGLEMHLEEGQATLVIDPIKLSQPGDLCCRHLGNLHLIGQQRGGPGQILRYPSERPKRLHQGSGLRQRHRGEDVVARHAERLGKP
jgi:hypothetical protein